MSRPYFLGIDAGTSRTFAAVARADEGGVHVHALTLGRNAHPAPSSIFVTSGDLAFGDAAERRGATQPERIVREAARRIGDDVPIIVGSRRLAPEDLHAHLIDWVVQCAAELEGGLPSRVTVTVPVLWGPHRTGLVAAAFERQGMTDVTLVAEPVAAARQYLETHPTPSGRLLAVYDLGGGRFDLTLVRTDGVGASLAATPMGIADLGGVDFDDAMVNHVISRVGADRGVFRSDGDARLALTLLRRECVDAKEALSFDSETVIPVFVGGRATTVRMTRDEFESMVEHDVERTVDVVATALDTAGETAESVDAILLTGGSSRIPRIAQMLSERLRLPIAADMDPKAIVAFGAARLAAEAEQIDDASSLDPTIRIVPATTAEIESSPAAPRRRRRRIPHFGAVAGALSAGAIVVAAATMGMAALNDETTEEPTTDLRVESPSPTPWPQPEPSPSATPGATS